MIFYGGYVHLATPESYMLREVFKANILIFEQRTFRTLDSTISDRCWIGKLRTPEVVSMDTWLVPSFHRLTSLGSITDTAVCGGSRRSSFGCTVRESMHWARSRADTT